MKGPYLQSNLCLTPQSVQEREERLHESWEESTMEPTPVPVGLCVCMCVCQEEVSKAGKRDLEQLKYNINTNYNNNPTEWGGKETKCLKNQ